MICHRRVSYRGSESRAQRPIIIFIDFFRLSQQFRARDKRTRVMLQLCVSVSIETRAKRVMYLTATHTLYLLIESWLFTAPDLFACTRKKAETSHRVSSSRHRDILQSSPVVYSRRRQRILGKLFRSSVARYTYAAFVIMRQVFSAVVLL